MKRFGRGHWKKVVKWISWFAGVWLLFFQPMKGHAESNKVRLGWNDDPATTMVIGWDQVSGDNPRVYYDVVDHGGELESYAFEQAPTRFDPYRGMNNHFAELKGLMPDTAYYFVIGDSEGETDRMWFRTAPDRPKPFTFITGGDTKSLGTPLRAGRWSSRMVSKLRPLFVLFNGDFCTGDGTNSRYWKRWLSDWSKHTRSEDGRVYPIVPVHGNHENGDMEVLHRLFATSNVDSNYGYYELSFAGGALQLVTLNSELEERPDEFDAQTHWLEETLASGTDHWLQMVAYHRPFRPHSRDKSNCEHLKETWAPLFEKYGVNMAFEAHAHIHKITHPIRPDDGPGSDEGFIRDDLLGTMYLGEGSWGAPPRDADDEKDWTLSRAALHQIKWLHVHPPSGAKAGRVNIYTVVTGTYSLYGLIYRERVEGTEALDESDVFAIPEGIKLLEAPEGRPCISYFPPKSAFAISGKLAASVNNESAEDAVDSIIDAPTCSPREGLVEPKAYIGCYSVPFRRSSHWLGFLAFLLGL